MGGQSHCLPGFKPGFEHDGAALHRGAALSVSCAVLARVSSYPPDQVGIRLYGDGGIAGHLHAGPIHAVAAHYLGGAARPVRAILFDKTGAANWGLGWHQDRTIAIAARRDLPGYGR